MFNSIENDQQCKSLNAIPDLHVVATAAVQRAATIHFMCHIFSSQFWIFHIIIFQYDFALNQII